MASYALPFVLTNADPRMRFPLDLLMTIQALRLFAAQSMTWLKAKAQA